MSSAPTTPSKIDDPFMGLSAPEVRVLLLGIVHQTDGKADHEKLAAKTGYTIGSARTVYNAARRKLMKLHGDGANCQNEDGLPPAKKRKSTGGSRKKKPAQTALVPNAAEEDAAEVVVKHEEFVNDEFELAA